MDNAKQTQINNKPHVELISIESSKDTISISSSKPQLENINDHVLPQIVTTQLCQSQSNQQTEPRDTSDIELFETSAPSGNEKVKISTKHKITSLLGLNNSKQSKTKTDVNRDKPKSKEEILTDEEDDDMKPHIGHAEAPKSDQAFIKNSLSLLLLLIIHVGPHLVSEEFISKLYPEIAEVSQI